MTTTLPVTDPIDRAFARMTEGLVHYRSTPGLPTKRPLILLHASPGSSRGLAPLMRALHAEANAPRVIAPDTPGNGDSFAPNVEDPDIPWFVDALVRTLDTLGIETADIYGAHTGARIACEAAAARPDRFGTVIFDGIGDYAPEMRQLLLENYAPPMQPDDYGQHLIWAFHFVRDQALHFPYFLRDPEHRLMTRPVPDASDLHERVVEVLKALRSYHKPYRAAFAYECKRRMPDITIPALMLCTANELPNLRAAAGEMAALMPKGQLMQIGPSITEKARAILAFLDQHQS